MKTVFFMFIFGSIFFFALNSTLEDMTKRDCEIHNISKACQTYKASY